MKRRHLPWILIAVATFAVACGSDDAQSHGEDNTTEASGRAVPTDRAVVLDDATLAKLTRVRPDGEQVELTFSGTTSVLDEVEVDDVLIAGTADALPNGALLVVEEIAAEGDELVLLVHRAELGEAFEELEVSLEAELSRPSETRGARSALTQGVAVSEQALGLSFPFSFSGEGDARAELSGSVAVDSSIGLVLDFSFEDGLSELSIRLEAEETFTAELIGEGESSFEEEVELGSISFAPITIIVPIPVAPGTLPVILTPQVVLEAGVRGTLQGEAQASLVQGAMFSAGLGYQDGEFGGTSDSDSTFSVEPPTYEGGASLRAWAGPRMEVLLYGAVGPYVAAEAFVELAAQVEGPPPCVTGVLNAGIAARAGVQVLADYETTLPGITEPLAQYDSCSEEDDPDAPRPAITWARTYARDGSPGETARAVIEASDGTYIVAGQSDLFDGVTGFAASAWVMKLDALGQVIWQRAFRREELGLVRDLVEVPRGFLLAGSTGVIKLDHGGNPIWANSYGGETLVEIASIAAHDDGHFVVAGIAGAEPRAWAMGLDESGEVLWSRSFAGEDFGPVCATADGGYAIAGKVVDAFDISVVKLDASGDVAWVRTVDNLFDPNPEAGDFIATSDDRAFDIAEKPDGGYVVVGDAYGNFPLPEPTPVGFYGTWVVELDADGELGDAGSVTHRAPAEALYGGAYAVAVRPDGTTVIVGRRADTADDLLVNEDVLVIQGMSYSLIGGAGNDSADGGTLTGNGRGTPLALTADGGAILAVTSNSFADRDEIWLLKLNRTAGINLPERSSTRGSSFVNGAAQSVSLEPRPSDTPVTATSFIAGVDWETTDLLTAQQAP